MKKAPGLDNTNAKTERTRAQHAGDMPPASLRRRDWFIPNATVFVASGCIMIVEILSTRLVARYLGSSVYTWTSAIGIVLAGISIGNYIGGRLADRFHARRTLAVLFILCSASCMMVPVANRWLGQWTALHSLAWPTRIFIHFAAVFLIPSTMLGTIGPVVAKSALNLGRATGRTIGTIYAWGAIGSIVGTFLAGFWLIGWIRSVQGTVFAVAGTLAVMGVLYGYRSWVPYSWAAAYLAAVVCAGGPWTGTRAVGAVLGLRDRPSAAVVYEDESAYQRIMVATLPEDPDFRVMVLDTLVHSVMHPSDPRRLGYPYEWVYAGLVDWCHGHGSPLSALVIGGGGYSFPRYLELSYPGSRVDVAEIDPAVTEAAHAAFGLPRDTSIGIHHMDGRNYVDDLIRRKRAGDAVPDYDFVFGDSISDFAVPFHLTTLEFTRDLHELLDDEGVYLLNLVDGLRWGRFLGAAVNTCRAVFPHVYVFEGQGLDESRDTFVVVSSKRPLDVADLADWIRIQYPYEGGLLSDAQLAELAARSEGLVLTDDYAPVENLVSAVVRDHRPEPAEAGEGTWTRFSGDAKDNLAHAEARYRSALRDNPRDADAHYHLGLALAGQDKLDAALAEFAEVLRLEPRHHGALYCMGRAYQNQGRLDEAVRAYRDALRIDPTHLASRYYVGDALSALGKIDEAIAAFRESLGTDHGPGESRLRSRLGQLLLKARRIDEAYREFEAILAVDPEHAGAHHGIGTVLLLTNRPAEAIPHFRQALRGDPNQPETHLNLGSALYRTGDGRAAAAHFTAALRLKPDYLEAHNNLATILREQGQFDEAIKHYREVLRLDPNHAPARRALDGLLNSRSATSGP